jgi:hypothetical protein
LHSEPIIFENIIPKTMCVFVKNDKNLNPIYTTDKFRFEYCNKNNNIINLTGYFEWNNDYLLFEINIIDDPNYVCSWYNVEYMSRFELIKCKE